MVVNPPTSQLRGMAAAQFSTGPLAVGQIGAIGLFNNTQVGEWLIVWDIEIHLFNAGSDLDIVDGALVPGFTQTLGLASPGAPLISQGKAPTGFVFGYIPLVLPSTLFFSSFISTGGYHWPHEWPLCAIQPGYSCTFYTAANQYNDYGVSFVWQVASGAP